ncbi:replicative DNA helicase [Paenibacillus jamilae]|jgi:replicative DNA helicase|uniref:AAA family ATPase n=1 Tax=Paenibacillus polymyxa TaxID=1406 RepID=UPI0015809B6A|nr:AAA family ATPase [Paenibacillus polymyxa]MDP9674826.1 replicative DNA helicase [Paenibacillus jamilae]MBY0023805.1 AAA family ATPase [Paenibacillus polymyxa]MBY0056477.1 AAA family ATPase [Paenibacillus polymyxa]MBY0071824.1 AAA family ATPase [Paenibacillus polymyxa]MBY0080610.1 AAA family ATPase [Paenibacillus polymyxa]
MSVYEEQLLSKIVDTGDVKALTRFGVVRTDFSTAGGRQAYDFVLAYADSNEGKVPSYATLTAECPDITYIPGVTDSFEYLTRGIKEAAARRMILEKVNGYVDVETGRKYESEFAQKFGEESPESFGNYLRELADGITMRTNVRNQMATDVKLDFEKFLAEYRARKSGESFRIWKSAFPYINTQIGGFFSSNMYTWYARSGRGKSVIVMVEALEAAIQGATVLVWALEMSAYEWLARAYSYLSAKSGVFNANFDGVDYEAGFDNKALLMGKLTDEFEDKLVAWLRGLNETVAGRIILRATDDADFRDKSVRQLEADILETGAEVVVIDPIYYLSYEGNTSRTAGGDAAATSKKLRLLAGRTKSVFHVITQADEDPSEKNTEGVRTLAVPQRHAIRKTKAVLEDAANTFGIDTLAHEGRGVIEVGKGRNGGEDTRVEIVYLPNYGVVREIQSAEDAGKFASGF